MSAADVEAPQQATDPAPAPGVPDYMLDPNAILKDNVTWRHGHAPDYSGTRKIYQDTKNHSHTPGSLENMVENLVKNWEIEASHKMKVSDWRTVDPTKYTFAINGGPPQDAEHMLKVGTYNAIIAPSPYYDPKHSDFDKSHKTFRDMMPNFAWEVVEVYSPPPVVAFKWRHWGVMRSDYIGWNNKGEEIRIRGHGGAIDIQGLTVAKLNDKLQVTALETWFDPVEMFNQMKPDLNKVEVEVNGHTLDKQEAKEMLENPEESGVEALAKQVNGNGDLPDLAGSEQMDGDTLASKDEVHVHNPSNPEPDVQEHSEEREAGGELGDRPRMGEADAPVSAGACPFLNGTTHS